MLLIVALLASCFFISSAGSQNYISPLTLSSETQATGSDVTIFVNATLRGGFPFARLSWFINNTSNVVGFVRNYFSTIQIFYRESQYRNRINISAQENISTIQSQMIITSLQKNENLEIGVLLTRFRTPVLIKLNVTDCPSYLPLNVVVDALSFTFGSSGTFSCPNNSDLFHSNGTLVASSSIQTQCLADATWSQQENLECWNAPSVKLYPENISGNENDIISLSCQAFGGFPSPYLYEFVLPVNTTAKPSINISIKLRREWNQQEIYCKAVTNYTTLIGIGKSFSKKMNVQYDPYTNEQPSNCIFYVSANSLPCEVKFYSNPSTDVYNLTKDGKNTTNDKPNPLQPYADGLHMFTFSKNKVSKSDAGLYTFSVESGLNPGMIDKLLEVNFTVVVKQAPPAPESNIALIAGASAGGVVALICIIVFVAIVLKNRNQDKKERKPDASTTPRAVVHINVPGVKTEQDHDKDDQADLYQQVVPSANYENVHHYETVGPKNQDGDDDPYIEFNN